MKIQTWVCFLMFLLPIIVFAQGSEMNSNKAQSQVKIIADKLSNGEIMRVEIINIPSYVLTYARITPEMLEKQFHYKLTISEIRGNVHNKQLLDAIKSMTIQTKSEMKDLRWGVIFYSVDESRIDAIYFDRTGRSGAVGNTPTSFTGDLFKWLDGNFSRCFR